jgi:hypothetical protein
MEEQKLWRLIIHRLHPGFGDIATSERRERIRSQGADAVIVRTEILFCKALISGLGGAPQRKGFRMICFLGGKILRGILCILQSGIIR